MDIGGTKVALRLQGRVDGAGALEDTFRWPAGNGAAADMDLIAERVRALLRNDTAPLRGVGLAVPAVCDTAGTVLTWPGRPSWTGLDLTAAVGRVFPDTPSVFADDGDLAALAEAREAGGANLLYLGVGTGVGGGLVVEGRSWPGPARGSCEVGHVLIDRDGPRCDCGRRGCVQAVASGPATLRRAAQLRGRETDFPALVEAFTAREPWARAAVDETAAALARAAVGICELAHPEIVCVGGGFAAGLPALVDSVAERVRELARPGVPPVEVRPAALGGRSSLRGAVLLAEETFGTTHRAGASAVVEHPWPRG
ncbi:ROK family protein [Streptomyces sp. V2I9]|uniref:ROK family protein n=1 Tax=Streptomyces sp. V2I9 TaxID=3042304 RepID=UPI0027D8BBA7|nr:ROK family protein [Streptomyces sp. V2I9]